MQDVLRHMGDQEHDNAGGRQDQAPAEIHLWHVWHVRPQAVGACAPVMVLMIRTLCGVRR